MELEENSRKVEADDLQMHFLIILRRKKKLIFFHTFMFLYETIDLCFQWFRCHVNGNWLQKPNFKGNKILKGYEL
jgi:hypothetical protein